MGLIVLEDIYRLASNPTRRRILLSLLQGEKSFSDLMRSVSMDPEHETGPFLYHMHRLEGVGLVLPRAGRYSLTNSGFEVAEALILVRRVLENANQGLPIPQAACLETSEGSKARSQHEGGQIMGSERNESAEDSDMVVRLLEEHDVDNVLEVLYHPDFHRKQPDHMRQHLTRVACRGLDRFSNNFVAQMDGRAVARMVVDTNYPPYVELAGLVVHPSYRGRGVSKELVKRFTAFAAQRDVPVQYVMVERNDHVAQSLYREFGFEPGIVDGFHEKGHEICMFRFCEGSLPYEFHHRYPLSQLTTSPDTSGDIPVSEMKWIDPLTGSKLSLCMKGKRHLSMPRISGVFLHEGGVSLDLRVEEETKLIGPDHEGVFRIKVANKGHASVGLALQLVLTPGTEVWGADEPHQLKLDGMSQEEMDFRIRMRPDFDVPALSFTTILVTCIIELRNPSVCDSPLVVSAGFEDIQYSKGEKGT